MAPQGTPSPVAFVTTPTGEWLKERLAACSRSLVAASPFVNQGFVALAKAVPRHVEKTLLTRVDLRDFAWGTSSLGALRELAGCGFGVLSLRKLHAKAYVLDDSVALVSSANATHAGMRTNWECGVALHDPEMASELAHLIRTGFGSDEPPQPATAEQLAELEAPVEVLREQLPDVRAVDLLAVGGQEPSVTLREPDSLVASFSGWRRLILEGLLAIEGREFALSQVYSACAALAAERYPDNRNVEAKLRQQLQELRDLGLVEFVEPGSYRKSFTVA